MHVDMTLLVLAVLQEVVCGARVALGGAKEDLKGLAVAISSD